MVGSFMSESSISFGFNYLSSLSGNHANTVEKYLKETLSNLQLDYLDLYLIHTPFSVPEFEGDIPKDSNGNVIFDKDTDHLAVWRVCIS